MKCGSTFVAISEDGFLSVKQFRRQTGTETAHLFSVVFCDKLRLRPHCGTEDKCSETKLM